MKKFILLIAIIIGVNVNAQTYFGFKVGANISDIYGDNSLSGMKASMHVGAVAEIQVSDLFSIQPELLYSMQGSQKKYSREEILATDPDLIASDYKENNNILKNNNHYITLPIMVKYFITDFISIDAGPQISYLVFAKTSNGWQEWTDTKAHYNAFDYGINLGASYEMDNGMNMNIRYSYGLANIYKSIDNISLKGNNATIQVSLGYKFY